MADIARGGRHSTRQLLRLHGPLTGAKADELLSRLHTLTPAPAEVEIDLSSVTVIDRSGAAVLLDAYVATTLRHGALALSGPSAECRASLLRFGVLDVIEVLDTRATQHGP